MSRVLVPGLRKGWEQLEDGAFLAPLEDIWRRVRRWARRNGKEYVSTYGVVGVAPV